MQTLDTFVIIFFATLIPLKFLFKEMFQHFVFYPFLFPSFTSFRSSDIREYYIINDNIVKGNNLRFMD